MARRARPGLAALMDVAQTRDAPSAMTCGYGLGPRINAGGRISEADLGLRLLLCEDALDARVLAERLDAVNRQRQTVEAGVLEAAMQAAESQIAAGQYVLLVSGERWHAGVVGIVAGRIKEKFNRPVCVGGVVDGVIKGSGRSIPGLDLGSAVIAARQSELLLTGGGHAMAAGFSLLPEKAKAFQEFLNERLQSPGRARRCARTCSWKPPHRPAVRRWNWRSISPAWRRSARAMTSRFWWSRMCVSSNATGSAMTATRCAPLSKAKAIAGA